MKFGYQQPSHDFDRGEIFQTLSRIALECEALGYDSFWLMDHLIQIELAGGIDAPILEPFTSLAALASLTSTIKLGTLCTCNLFRSPALVAKMGATLDQISAGRFWLGIGAGWYEEEAEMYGYRFPGDRDRLGMLEESVKIISESWSSSLSHGTDALSFHGRYYDVENLTISPRPLKRRPSILIGGGGEEVTLELVARYADACNLFPKGEVLERKLCALEQHCRNIGRDYSSILKTKLATVMFGEGREDALQKISRYKPESISLSSYALSTLLGTPAEMVSEIEEYGALGIDYLIINFRGKYRAEDKSRFAREVMRSF